MHRLDLRRPAGVEPEASGFAGKLLQQNLLEIRACSLLQLIADAHCRFVDLQDSSQVDRRADDNDLSIGIIYGLL